MGKLLMVTAYSWCLLVTFYMCYMDNVYGGFDDIDQ